MKRAFKIIAWGAFLGILAFAAVLISFGGSNKVSLQRTIINSATLIPSSVGSLNLTEKLTNQLTTEIIEKNPEGPTADGEEQSINAPSPETFAAQVLKEQLQTFDPQTLIPAILEENIKIVTPTTVKNSNTYFTRYFTILEKASPKIAVNSENPELTDFAAISRAYKDTMAELAALETPDKIVDIQIQSLELLGAQANIFELYSKQAEDPLKALFAAQLQKQITEEASELQKKVLSYIIE